MAKLNILAKGGLLIALLLCLLMMAVSGTSLAAHWGDYAVMVRTHHIAGGMFLLLLAVHLVHRRKKLRKNISQLHDVLVKQKYPSYCNLDRLIMTFAPLRVTDLAERLNLPLNHLLEEFAQGRVKIRDPQQSLRDNLKDNDERLFAAITIALELGFKP